MNKKIVSLLLLVSFILGIFGFTPVVNANDPSFMSFRNVDKRTFNEYRYKLTKEFLNFERSYQIHNKTIDKNISRRLIALVKSGYRFLPDNLKNQSLELRLLTSLEKGIANPDDVYNYSDIKNGIRSFISNAVIPEMTGSIDATPISGNAPLVTTLRANVKDPTGVNIPKSSYVWWMDFGNGVRKVLGTGPFISKRFTREGNFTVFLDVKSSHKNKYGNNDVIPYQGKIEIKVEEKIASIALRISGKKISSTDEIKFSPEESRYGLIFDATSSYPATGTTFIETYWDFGNGVKKSYNGRPRIERVVYNKEGDYDVTLKIKTNRGRVVDKKFKVFVHNPVAVIDAKKTEGFMGEKFTFTTKVHGKQKGLTFLWEIFDMDNDKRVLQKSGNKLTHSFKSKGRFSVVLKITDNVGNVGVDTKLIYINSKPPVPSFNSKVLLENKPNEVYFDATSTFDPDFSDEGHLRYTWNVDGMKINLEKSNDKGSTGYYTFDSIGEHSIILEVEDPDGIVASKKGTVKIKSLLSVDFLPAPRVIQRNKKIRFLANSKNAKFFEWDFGDGEKKSIEGNKIKHAYEKSGIYNVTLKVRGINNDSNTLVKQVYIGDSKNPVAILDLGRGKGGFNFKKEPAACKGKDAYIVSRADNIQFSSKESIDTNGKTSGLAVSWKIGDKFIEKPSLSYKFDELGCFRVKLTVKSKKDKTTDSREEWIKVENLKPEILGIKVSPIDINSDPVIVNVKTVGAKDRDGVIQSYLWFYTTDLDNAAQDFKITTKPNASFVLPKVPGNYHFGVILKDNNNEKTNSDDVLGKNTLMLAGDNTNTPLIDLKPLNASIAVGETINFTAKATNILGKSIDRDSKFSWDFDGDGFYDKKDLKTGRVAYKYKKSGVFYAKVKVWHKGFSNTRIVTVNVVNKLNADFEYISIGNKYIFINKSIGGIDNYKWELGDGNEAQNKTKFVYRYDDKKPVHKVKLTVSEGTKVKRVTKIVKKDLRNILKTRKEGINLFTFPKMDSDGKIVLDREESVFVYLGESKGKFKNYGIDYDLSIDSNLNGSKDDDIQNEHNLSFVKGDPDEIILNKSRIQNVRLFLLDKDGNTVDSKDIVIEKTYIEEKKTTDIGEIKGVSTEIKIKIDELKTVIKSMPIEYRLDGMDYIRRLQEQWDDETERMRTILEFESFINDSGVENDDEIIKILEGLIVTEGEDNGEKAVAYTALKMLIPKEIQCETSGEECREFILKKLENINNSSDEKVNRKLGKEILLIIEKTKLMNEEQKNDFKAILRILIYSSQDKIPESDVKTIIDKDKETGKTKPTDVEPMGDDPKDPTTTGGESGKLMPFLKNVGKWVLWGLGILFVGMFVFWLLDFIKKRKKDDSDDDFEDFSDNSGDDILGNLENTETEVADPLKGNTEEKKSAIFSEPESNDSVKVEDPLAVVENKDVEKTETVLDKTEGEVPDWLSGGNNVETTNNIPETKIPENNSDIKDEKSKEEENMGFSLSTGDDDDDDGKKAEEPEIKEPISSEPITEKVETAKVETNLEEEEVPSWLQENVVKELPKKKELKEEDFLEENNTSDEVEKEVEPVIIEDKKEENINLDEEIPDWLKSGEEDSNDIADETKIDTAEPKKENIKEENIKEENKVEENKEEVVDTELGNSEADDIPDWLQGSIEEESKNKSKANSKDVEKKQDKKGNLDNEDVPDWLKDSLEEGVDKKKKENLSDKKNKKEEKTEDKKEKTEDKKNKNTENIEKKDDKKDKLWDEDVDVPDWLKDD